jgi:hypothetical protein
MIEFLEALSECTKSVAIWGVVKCVLGKEGCTRLSVRRREKERVWNCPFGAAKKQMVGDMLEKHF